MPTSEQAILYYEADQDAVAMAELTDQGDQKDFRGASALWSGRSGFEPVVLPNGLVSGGVVTPESSATNDQVDIAAAKAYLAGVLKEPAASPDQAITRATTDTHLKSSITITTAGAFAVVAGSEGTSFSETRGANGGPPWIPNTSIEIAQVWLDAQAAAPIKESEIKQVKGSSLERWDYPLWETYFINVSGGILDKAGIVFHSALPLIHSDDAGSTTFGKDVHGSHYTPVFVEIVDAYDFVPPAEAHTINTTQVYGRVKGSKSSTMNPGSFNVELQDGISDNLLEFENLKLWFKFKSDRLKTPYILAQGYLGVGQAFPAGANINAACTISAEIIGDRVTQ